MPLLKELINKKHIIWDWNGTILNDVQYAVETINTLLHNHNLKTVSLNEYKTLFEFPIRKYYDKLGFDYSKKSFEDLCDEFVATFMSDFSSCLPFKKIEEVLLHLKKLGKTQSVLSASDQENLDKMIHHFDFLDYFDFVYGIDNKYADSKIGRGKELISHAPFLKAETVLIGDTIHDLEVGEELGIDVILITHGHQCEKILLSRHHKVVNLFI